MKIYVVYSESGFGDITHNIIVYVGTDHDKAVDIASNGGSFPSEYNRWNTLEAWENEKKVSEISYDAG